MRHTNLLVLTLAVTALPTALWAEPWRDARPVPFPLGLADAANDIGYVANAGGGIDALSLQDGHVVWTAAAPPHFLTLSDHRMFVWKAGRSPSLAVVTLDARNGQQMSASQATRLPDWVATGADGDGGTFTCSAVLHQNQLTVDWTASAWWTGGMVPSRELLERSSHHEHGEFRVDLATGQITASRHSQEPPKGPLVASASGVPSAVVNGRLFAVQEGTQGDGSVPRSVGCRQGGRVLWTHSVAPRRMIYAKP